MKVFACPCLIFLFFSFLFFSSFLFFFSHQKALADVGKLINYPFLAIIVVDGKPIPIGNKGGKELYENEKFQEVGLVS